MSMLIVTLIHLDKSDEGAWQIHVGWSRQAHGLLLPQLVISPRLATRNLLKFVKKSDLTSLEILFENIFEISNIFEIFFLNTLKMENYRALNVLTLFFY